jgi:GAF domain-containing protein
MAETTLVGDKLGAERMGAAEEEELYGMLGEQIRAVIEPERDLLAAMASIVCILHNAFPYYFWTGFYRRVEREKLLIGPYQGTLGCLDIAFSQGVCGAAARERRTFIIADVHAFPGHIACDPNSASEIVVPVFDSRDELIAVLDVDSHLRDAFDEVDQRHLESIVALLREKEALPLVWTR